VRVALELGEGVTVGVGVKNVGVSVGSGAAAWYDVLP